MRPQRDAYLLLLATTLFWGGNAIAGKLAVGHISPMLLTLGRWGFALVILAALGWPRIQHDWPVLRAHWLKLFALGALGFTGFNIALYSALLHTTAVNVSIEQAGIPMLIFLLNFLFFRMAVRPLQLLGLALSIAGVMLTASHGDLRRILLLEVNQGDALMLGSILSYAVYTVALRYKPVLHWQSLMTALTAGALLAAIPFTVAEFALGHGIVPDARGWAILVYVVIFPSILSQIFYIRGVELIGANRAGLFINLVPVFGTLLSVAWLGEQFYAWHALALGLVFGGIWLAESSGRRSA